jgi:hypothetical protein
MTSHDNNQKNSVTTLLFCHLILFATEEINSIWIRNEWYRSADPYYNLTDPEHSSAEILLRNE